MSIHGPSSITFPLFAASAAFLLCACDGETKPNADSASGGTIVIAATSDPDALFPPAALNVEARQATELIYEYLADVGVSMNTIGDSGFVKQLAEGWTWSKDSMSIAFRINSGARWHDGTRVTARDVAFTYRTYRNPSVGAPGASSLADIDSVTIPDFATAIFWFARRSPYQFFNAAATMSILPVHVLGSIPADSLRSVTSMQNPIGSGRFRFARWDRGSHFEVQAVDGHYRGSAKPSRVIWTITPEYQSAVTKLVGGAADVFAPLRQETIAQLTSGGQFNVVTLPGMDYVFMELNLRNPSGRGAHPLFGSRDLRRALTMAVDRTSMVKNLFDTLATVSIGPAVRAFPTTDTSLVQIPFDRSRAERLLDSLGWARGSDGIRAKGGRALRFSMLVPVSSLSRKRIAVLLQEQLRQAGVDMRIDEMDYSSFAAGQSGRRFDAALAAWHLGSSPAAVRGTWTSAAAEAKGLNYGSYRNADFDALVDSALTTERLADSRDYFRRANQIIVDDAPAIWLYEPKTILGIHKRIKTTPMRPNSWWLGIAGWHIPPAERIGRDASIPKS